MVIWKITMLLLPAVDPIRLVLSFYMAMIGRQKRQLQSTQIKELVCIRRSLLLLIHISASFLVLYTIPSMSIY